MNKYRYKNLYKNLANSILGGSETERIYDLLKKKFPGSRSGLPKYFIIKPYLSTDDQVIQVVEGEISYQEQNATETVNYPIYSGGRIIYESPEEIRLNASKLGSRDTTDITLRREDLHLLKELQFLPKYKEGTFVAFWVLGEEHIKLGVIMSINHPSQTQYRQISYRIKIRQDDNSTRFDETEVEKTFGELFDVEVSFNLLPRPILSVYYRQITEYDDPDEHACYKIASLVFEIKQIGEKKEITAVIGYEVGSVIIYLYNSDQIHERNYGDIVSEKERVFRLTTKLISLFSIDEISDWLYTGLEQFCLNPTISQYYELASHKKMKELKIKLIDESKFVDEKYTEFYQQLVLLYTQRILKTTQTKDIKTSDRIHSDGISSEVNTSEGGAAGPASAVDIT